jgi:hypothetical protein
MVTLIGEENVRYVEEVATDLRKHPELCFQNEFLEMGREEQMHAWWKKLRAFYDLDKEKYFYRKEAANFYRWCFF